MTQIIPFRERISCTIPEACSATGLGRTKLYEEIGAGRVQARKIGNRTLIVVDSLMALTGSTARAPKGHELRALAEAGRSDPIDENLPA